MTAVSVFMTVFRLMGLKPRRLPGARSSKYWSDSPLEGEAATIGDFAEPLELHWVDTAFLSGLQLVPENHRDTAATVLGIVLCDHLLPLVGPLKRELSFVAFLHGPAADLAQRYVPAFPCLDEVPGPEPLPYLFAERLTGPRVREPHKVRGCNHPEDPAGAGAARLLEIIHVVSLARVVHHGQRLAEHHHFLS
ncbi:hypothetical protein [Palleronia sp. LCG004]|uniref:hypothetical protein n=1 Tax=Palleronia sp. LCG004 TaxID=3079304 RepID=UPI0029429E0A|nr:hypothetical protein [Palleronia sp. LCG004]WOI56593.1 hypothetical protein RVY76_01990 [Palleronia sp. LCG004]